VFGRVIQTYGVPPSVITLLPSDGRRAAIPLRKRFEQGNEIVRNRVPACESVTACGQEMASPMD
jgi:hypothetical protein